jgi:anti-sigma factor RsiW
VTDDELISAYVDGQLNAQERTALEARAHGDGAFRRRLAAAQSGGR